MKGRRFAASRAHFFSNMMVFVKVVRRCCSAGESASKMLFQELVTVGHLATELHPRVSQIALDRRGLPSTAAKARQSQRLSADGL